MPYNQPLTKLDWQNCQIFTENCIYYRGCLTGHVEHVQKRVLIYFYQNIS